MKNKGSNGCVTVFVILLGIGLLVTYWYVFLAVAVIGGAVWYYLHQKHAAAAAAAAAAARQREAEAARTAAEGSKVEQIRRYKALLDEGAITPSEYDAQKRKLLGEDEDELKF